MAITKITVYSSIDSMGPEATQADVAAYNEWLWDRLAAEYPDAEIDVIDRQSLRSVEVWVDGEWGADDSATDEVKCFVQHCWDTCPWNF